MYSSHTAIYAGTGTGDVTFDDAVLADNDKMITVAAYHTVANSLLVADSQTGLFNFPVPYLPFVTAYNVYDGAGSLIDSHLVGYDADFSTFIANQGGATKHTNHVFEGLTFDNTGGASQHNMFLPDFAAAQRECGDTPQSLYDPRKWTVALRDMDGSVTGLAGATITGNHPMMNRWAGTGALRTNVLPGDVPWDLQAGANVWISPYRFGSFRIRYLNTAGNPIKQTPDLSVTREAHPLWEAETYFHCSQADQHKQFPLVLGEDGFPESDGYEYTVDWMGATPTDAPNADTLRVILDDLADGDTATVRLTWPGLDAGIGDPGDIELFEDGRPVGAPMEYGTLSELKSAATTGYHIPSGAPELWLRFVTPVDVRTVHFELYDLIGQ